MRSVPSINLWCRLFLFAVASFPLIGTGQALKISPELLGENWMDTTVSEYVIAVKSRADFKTLLNRGPQLRLINELQEVPVFVVRASRRLVKKYILPDSNLVFLDRLRIPREELPVSNLDLSLNRVNTLHSLFPQLDGEGLRVSVKENRPDTTDIDLKGRYLHTPFTSPNQSTHATIMATIVAGAGNSYYEGRGVASGAGITSFDFATLLPESDAVYQQYSISVQNHSYGTGIENYYGPDAMAYDASVQTRPALLHAFSAGNSGTLAATSGIYANLSGFANLTGSFKMAKNIITVGHTDSFGTVLPASSRGPAYDGRLKPELVAFGSGGSSGAAAIVSGVGLLLQQSFREQFGLLPPSSLVKAILLNSADDAGPPGLDYQAGYGQVNALRAVQTVKAGNFFSGNVGTGATAMHALSVPAGVGELRITLVWTDPPASANAARALRNDLDLRLTLPSSGGTWLPWVLSHFPHPDSLRLPATRKRDSLNVAEQITIADPAPGNYQILVTGTIVAPGGQSYSIAYELVPSQQFTWTYPTRLDNLFPGRRNVIRWESGYGSLTGQLEWSTDNGNSWQAVSGAINLAARWSYWLPPVNFKTALLRMKIGSEIFVSDTFTISDRRDLLVGFNCPDSFAFHWSPVPGADVYRFYRLGDRYMEPFLQTTDTFLVLQKALHPSLHYAMAPVIGGKTALRSYAYNYTLQGVGCYIRSFLVQLVGESAVLTLDLGTLYNIRTITWEKLTAAGFVPLQSGPPATRQFTDNNLKKGLNTYRVRIDFVNGAVIYSQPETVYFLGDEQFLIYPNPVSRSAQPVLINVNFENIRVQLFSSIGNKIIEWTSRDRSIPIPVNKLQPGMYLLRILQEDGVQAVLQLLVL
ncbi:MAG TPA: S8 family peptidase [Chitinophagaceae bacterium]|nr:S8 family peptidase [Chitinophagaceae bacterium]